MNLGGLCAIAGLFIAAAPGVALADASQADRLVAEGEALGKAGNFDAALAKFREAEREHPRAAHDCWIALAQGRMGRWTSARFHLDRCQERASGGKPVAWFEAVATQIQDGLDANQFAAVRIATNPPGASVEVTGVRDETFTSPVTLYLRRGKQAITVSLDGYATKTHTITVDAQEAVTLEMSPTPSPWPPDERPTTTPSKVPWILIGTGAAATAVAGVLHYVAIDKKQDAERATNLPDFENRKDTYWNYAIPAIGLYSLGGAAIAGGVYLLVRRGRDSDAPRVSIGPDPRGGGVVTFGGRF